MAENVDTSALIEVSDRSEIGVPENKVPGTAVNENNVNSGSDTAVVQTEPEWYRNGDAWVKIFLEPDGAERAGDVAPGKFKQHDHIFNVPGKNEFPKEMWNAKESESGFHITRRRDVWFHLSIHDYKSAYIAEVVSTGDEFYDFPLYYQRKVRVVTLGPAVPLLDMLGECPYDYFGDKLLTWAAANGHIDLVKRIVGNNPNYTSQRVIEYAIKNGHDQVSEIFIEKYVKPTQRHIIMYNAIEYNRLGIVRRLVEKIPTDKIFFQLACEYSRNEIFQILCKKYGEPKCSEIIPAALRGGDTGILDHIKSRGVSMADAGLLVYVLSRPEAKLKTIEYLVSNGANLKRPFIAYLAGRASDEVRVHLNINLVIKTDVSSCGEYEREVIDILDDLSARLRAGVFDKT
jgi:hypothetical protein